MDEPKDELIDAIADIIARPGTATKKAQLIVESILVPAVQDAVDQVHMRTLDRLDKKVRN